MSYVAAFVRFWYDFIVGDDWRVAVGVIVTIAITAALARTDVPAWWLLPATVITLLGFSLWRATRQARS